MSDNVGLMHDLQWRWNPSTLTSNHAIVLRVHGLHSDLYVMGNLSDFRFRHISSITVVNVINLHISDLYFPPFLRHHISFSL